MYQKRFNQHTLRFRLTAWYILLLGCTLTLFSGYLYFQLKKSLLQQLDTSLEVAASQTLTNLLQKDGHPVFQETEASTGMVRRFRHQGFAIRLVSLKNEVWDSFGDYKIFPQKIPQKKGYQTLNSNEGRWRVYNYPIQSHGIIGWLQVAQSLQPLSEASEHLLLEMVLSLPFVLIIAGFGGLLLADRTLQPIERIIRTAQAIRPYDFTQRINYQGSIDEVSRLSQTLDKMLDRIQAAFERERRFTADIAHELRTPLTALKGKIGVTLSQTRNTTDYLTTLEALDKESDRLIRLTQGLLVLARLEQEEIEKFTIFPLNLTDLLEIILEQIQPLANEREIILTANIEPNLIILGESDYLTSLFLNLLDNAIKYSDEGGEVRFNAIIDEKNVKISITNTGKGISPHHFPHLFNPFYRVETSQKSHQGGTGLGLAICYEIIRLHRGNLTVESQLNQLTIFTVYLPRQV